MKLTYRKTKALDGTRLVRADECMAPEEALAHQKRAVFLYGPIMMMEGAMNMREDWHAPHILCDTLLLYDMESNDPIWLFIDSPGGLIDTALGIYDTIKTLRSPVYTVSRLSASAAVPITAGGTPGHRYVYENSRLFIHQPFSHAGTMTATEARKHSREMMEVYRKVAKILKSDGAKPSVEHIMADMKKETWLTADEAVKYGLVDKVLEKGELWKT